MLNILISIGVVIVQLTPNFVIEFFHPDVQWQVYSVSMAVICTLLSLLFFTNVSFGNTLKSRVLKFLALLIMLIAIYDMTDLTLITYLENINPSSSDG